jgi:hypothetical protein
MMEKLLSGQEHGRGAGGIVRLGPKGGGTEEVGRGGRLDGGGLRFGSLSGALNKVEGDEGEVVVEGRGGLAGVAGATELAQAGGGVSGTDSIQTELTFEVGIVRFAA